jgi:hypothetical protein
MLLPGHRLTGVVQPREARYAFLCAARVRARVLTHRLGAGKEISIVARKALVKIAKLLQNVFNETGMEEDATSPELYQNFICGCIPKFHHTIFMITVRPTP